MSYSANLNINIPTTHYVGFQKRSDDLPLGFMTPDGTDKAAMKRKSTVDSWAKGYGQTKSLPAKTLDNKPMTGFKFGRNISGGGSGWNSRHDKWRVQDPRGFELEITSGNLEVIMRACTIEKGEVLEQCIWARLGSDNILLPLDTDEYRKATANTQRLGSKGSVRDLVPGASLVFKNGQTGTFVGRLFMFGYEYRKIREDSNKRDKYYSNHYEFIQNPEYKILNDKAIFVYMDSNGRAVARTSLNLANVDTSTEKTAEEMISLANKYLRENEFNLDVTDTWSYHRILQLVADSSGVKNFTAARKLVPLGDYDTYEASLMTSKSYFHNYVIAQIPDGRYGWGYMSSSYRFGSFTPQELDEFALVQEGRIVRRWKDARRDYWGGYHRPDSVNLDIKGLNLQSTDVQMFDLVLEFSDQYGNNCQIKLNTDYE